VAEHKADAAMQAFVEPLEKSLGHLQASTLWLMENAATNPNNAGAAAYAYMDLISLVALGFMWAQMAKAAQVALASGATDTEFYTSKLIVARYFAERHLPDTSGLQRKIEAGSDTIMQMAANAF
jgi:hypothetical protein